jgi:hypothetical protein
MDSSETRERFKTITHASDEKADFYLSAADWDLQRAIDMFLARALNFPALAHLVHESYRYAFCRALLMMSRLLFGPTHSVLPLFSQIYISAL